MYICFCYFSEFRIGCLVICICMAITYGLGNKNYMYTAFCDAGMRPPSLSFVVANFPNTSSTVCAYECMKHPECRTFDVIDEGKYSNCLLINSQSYSGCPTSAQTRHYARVSRPFHEIIPLQTPIHLIV